jgi:glucokinase
LSERAESDTQCREIFEEFASGLASFLSKPIADTQAEVLVVCGNIARASKFFLPQLKRQLNHIAIELAQLGEDAALIGAAAVFEQKIDQSRLL